MAMTTVQQILAAGDDLVPWIESRAFMYAMHNFVMAPRVLTVSDLPGSWNIRKVSEYSRVRMAQALSEGVAIGDNKVNRKRTQTIEPSEWGDRYPVTNRRSGTDPEPILADIVQFLGYSLGRRKEYELFNLIPSFEAGSLGSSSSAYSMDLSISMQALFAARGFNGQLFHVIHPYQALDVKKDLIDLSKPASEEFRSRFIRSWDFGGFGGLNITEATLLPRKVKHRLLFNGVPTGGTFRLSVIDLTTASITFSGTPATLAGNIQTALNALGIGTFAVADGGGGITDIEVTPPATLYLDHENELRIAVDADGDSYTALTGGTNPTLTIQEISASARAPFFERESIIHDARQGVQIYREWFPSTRTLDIGGTEVYGVGMWRPERAGYIESDATSPVAVP